MSDLDKIVLLCQAGMGAIFSCAPGDEGYQESRALSALKLNEAAELAASLDEPSKAEAKNLVTRANLVIREWI